MEKGDIIRWEYDAWIVEGDKEELVDTTNEELAKENGIHDPNLNYGPMVSIVGAGRLIKGMEDELLKAEVGKENIVEIPPEKGYGERDPKLVKIHSYRELVRQKIEPEIGKEVIINNKKGKIITVTPGRVIIDFNHPLAGKTLKYRFKVLEKIEKNEEKIRAIIQMNYGKDLDKFKIRTGKSFDIELPDSCKYDAKWSVSKYLIVSDIRDYVANKDIRFIEVYKKKEEEKKEEEKKSEEKTVSKEKKEEKESNEKED